MTRETVVPSLVWVFIVSKDAQFGSHLMQFRALPATQTARNKQKRVNTFRIAIKPARHCH